MHILIPEKVLFLNYLHRRIARTDTASRAVTIIADVDAVPFACVS